jgi:multiple sugar transport system substrate-binding protein
MKKLLYVLLIPAALISCSKSDSGAKGPDREFFNRNINGEITVSAFDTMNYRNYLEEAARAFEQLHPGTKINIETFSAMPEVRTGGSGNMQMQSIQMQNDPQARSDYLSRLNTNLMSGTGADIYAMDIIPLQKFVESGNLENLELYLNLDPDFNMNEYRQNIFNSSKYSDGLWFLPMDYTFNYFAYDSTLIPANIASAFGAGKSFNTSDLLKMGIPLYDGSYRLFNTTDFDRGLNGMFSQLFNENYEEFVNLSAGRAYFQNGGFAALLSSVREYGQQGYIPRAVTGQQDAGRLMRQAAEAPRDRFYFKLNNNFSLATQYMRSTGRMVMMFTGGSVIGIEDDDKVAGIQANADGSIPYRFNNGFGINSQSKNKELAWAFIKFLLSKEMQLSTNLNAMGLPVHNEARAEKSEMTFSGSLYGMSSALNEQGRQSLREYMSVMESLSDLINSYSVRDTNITDMVIQDVQFFIDGSRSADEAARVLQNKADLYLSE